jgi:oxygen-dependent protoporphyrinogen oxidase
MGLKAEPRFIRIFRHRRGIPQYTLGHLDRLSAIEEGLARHPGLLVSGNSYRGISVNACAAEAPGIAADAMHQLDA